jgi:hypothetical protein
MPSVLHSNPTDRAIVDMYVIVLTAETDLALTADRKAPPLGLESPNEAPADSRRRAQLAPETVLTSGPRLTSRSRHTWKGRQPGPYHLSPPGLSARASSRSSRASRAPARAAPSALKGHAPGDQHPLGWPTVGVQLQVDRIQEQIHGVALVEPALVPAAVVLAGVLPHARDRRLRDHRLIELCSSAASTSRTGRPRKNEQITSVCSAYVRDALANDPRLEPQPRRVPGSRSLHLHRPQGGRDRLRPLVPLRCATGVSARS